MGHDCRWRIVELRRDGAGIEWARDECAHGWAGGWFRRDGALYPLEPPWSEAAVHAQNGA